MLSHKIYVPTRIVETLPWEEVTYQSEHSRDLGRHMVSKCVSGHQILFCKVWTSNCLTSAKWGPINGPRSDPVSSCRHSASAAAWTLPVTRLSSSELDNSGNLRAMPLTKKQNKPCLLREPPLNHDPTICLSSEVGPDWAHASNMQAKMP